MLLFLQRHCQAYAVIALWAAEMALPGQTLTTLHNFDGTDGQFPSALMQATNGAFYGTAEDGGSNGDGTVFKITREGAVTTWSHFCDGGLGYCPNGYYPLAGLVQATSGEMYGSTYNGGINHWGTIFEITPSGALTTLYSFCGKCPQGSTPFGALVQAANGYLYGATSGGGMENANCVDGCGTIFKMTLDGTLTTLYTFCAQAGCPDGEFPYADLIQASDGNLYGTAYDGGPTGTGGTVFAITPSGTFSILHTFCAETGCTDGQYPNALIQGVDGNFYGTTYGGGANNGGTIFKLTPSGAFTILYSFCAQTRCTDGENPNASLVQGTDGNLYGSTPFGGRGYHGGGGGTLFQITPSGALTTVYNFCARQESCVTGLDPRSALIQGTDGDFYGTTYESGSAGGDGTVFRLSMGLGPFVKPQIVLGKVGTAVNILGTDLTETTTVSFNGTTAPFTVVSASLITATVPTGATSGTIRVVTPSGTLSSNVPYHVLP